MKNHQTRHAWLNLKNISLFVGIIGVLVTAIYYYIEIIKPNIFPEPSFIVSIDSLRDSLQQGGILQHTVTVRNLNDYDEYTVSLSAGLKTGNLPEGLILEFQPPTGGPKPSYSSSLLISAGKDFPAGKYDLLIKGTGSTGYETSCSFTLNVISAAPEPDDSDAIPAGAFTTAIPVDGSFFPSGWMGDYNDLTIDDACPENPHSSDTCIKITYSAKKTLDLGWAGIYWQYPDKNFGEFPGYDWTGKNISKLTFWAKGSAVVIFKVGGIYDKGQPYHDSISAPISTGSIILEKSWKQYTIDLRSRDLSSVIGGFCFAVNYKDNAKGCTFYLDDIQYE